MSAGRKINTLSKTWGTPLKYVHAVRSFFNGRIDFDPCSNEWSKVDATVECVLPTDGLKALWNHKRIFVNPPYGIDRERGTSIKDWLLNCSLANEAFGSEVLALVPVAPNTKHWKNFVFGAATGVCFLSDTRLKFLVNGEEGGKGAPMACCMVYWGKHFKEFEKEFDKYGACVCLNNLKDKK